MALKIYSECCKNCLLSENRIVSPTRAKEIVKSCTKNQTHFACHKASFEDKDIMCKTFYEKFGDNVQMLRIAERLNMVEFVPQTDSEKLVTYAEQKSK